MVQGARRRRRIQPGSPAREAASSPPAAATRLSVCGASPEAKVTLAGWSLVCPVLLSPPLPHSLPLSLTHNLTHSLSLSHTRAFTRSPVCVCVCVSPFPPLSHTLALTHMVSCLCLCVSLLCTHYVCVCFPLPHFHAHSRLHTCSPSLSLSLFLSVVMTLKLPCLKRRGGSEAGVKERIWVAVHWPPARPTQLVSSSFGGELLLWDLTKPGKQRWTLLGPTSEAQNHSRIVFNLSSARLAGGQDLLFSISMDREVSQLRAISLSRS
uniref:Gem-associated protein 5-like n=1 Tax=Callorhinchus milii TaxID=7868 RepID=A0A4W3H146_CALMI